LIGLLIFAASSGVSAKPEPQPPQPTVEPDWSVVRQESEAALKASLIDPGSAQIKWTKGFVWGWFKPMFERHYYGWVACGMINAKNRMGGYVGDTPFIVVYDGGVQYTEMDSLVEQACSNISVPPQAALLDVPVPSSGPVSVADELQKLADLRDRGVLTQEEFEAQKAKLLGEPHD
jgi:hypothetical protein